MTVQIPGSGDPDRRTSLLWRTPSHPDHRPGPRSSLDVDRIVTAAIGLADRDGLGAVSMRRVAAELGVGAMTLYGHVPGKGELVDLMLDSVLTELYADGAPAGNWRARLHAVADENRKLFLRHPWAVHLAPGRPPLGPHAMRKYELELRAVDGLGLSDLEMDLLVGLVNGFALSAVNGPPQGAAGDRAFIDADRFPTAARVGRAGADRLSVDDARKRSFDFGLERLLDGIGVLILDASR
jgi:AcrR family transcriptional regulator